MKTKVYFKRKALIAVLISGIFLSVIPAATKAQGNNLQFNEVKLVTTVETVPANKVWKVEAALGPMLVSNCTTTNPGHVVIVNGATVNVGTAGKIEFDGYCYGWKGVALVTEFPFWLPGNATLAAGTNVTAVSVIEFNIVP